MFTWRFQLNRARRAEAEGRLDEAARVLGEPGLLEYLPAKRLAGRVADGLVDEARTAIASHDTLAGLHRLEEAERLVGDRPAIRDARRVYWDAVLEDVLHRLEAADPAGAAKRLHDASAKITPPEEARALGELAQGWERARKQTREGDPASADVLVELSRRADGLATIKVAQLLRDEAAAAQAGAALNAQAERGLHAAAAGGDWSQVIALADGLLATAPMNRLALRLRRMAWEKVGLRLTQPYHPGADRLQPRYQGPGAMAPSTLAGRLGRDETMTQPAPAERRMLWIDSVGGYLLCLDQEVTIGQPGPGASPSLPILADISRRHAVLRREGGRYVLEPFAEVRVAGRPIHGPTPLDAESEIELGAVRLRLVRPHALSATARLVIESGHRTVPAADGVLLMAESCVLGPRPHSHIVCRKWKDDLVVFRQGVQLLCRSSAALEIDGTGVEGPAVLAPGRRVEGEDFALSIEDA